MSRTGLPSSWSWAKAARLASTPWIETFQNQFITLMISGLMDEATAHDLNLMLFATQRLQTAEEVVMQCRQRGLGARLSRDYASMRT